MSKKKATRGRPKRVSRLVPTTVHFAPEEHMFLKEMAGRYGLSIGEMIRHWRVRGAGPAALHLDFTNGTFHGVVELELEAAQLIQEELAWRLRLNAFSLKLPGAMQELRKHRPEGIPLPGGQRAVPPSAEIGAEKPAVVMATS